RKSRTNTISSPIGGFPISDANFANTSAYGIAASAASPSYPQHATSSPFFNMTNGIVPFPPSDQADMSQADVDFLTCGAPLSPTADALLPSDLLGNEEPPSPGASVPSITGI